MKKILIVMLTSMLFMLANSAFALDPAHAKYAAQLSSGIPSQVRAGGTGLHGAGIVDQEIIDIAVESVLVNASKGKDFADPLRFVVKAVTAAKNPRYHTAMMSIADDKSLHRKLRKDAKKAANAGGKPTDTEQYAKGGVDLEAIKAEAQKAQQELAKSIKAPEGFESIGIVTVGMSSSEVIVKCGPPTSTTSHITGKNFIPFNFKGSDTVRTYYLYKGQGTVVMANNSRYTSNASVVEVTIDPNEVGYR